MPKDLFSDQAHNYARYRPTYPDELFLYLLSFVSERHHAWDCATGNGQAAIALLKYFTKVFATDISEAQLKQAPSKSNIEYRVCPAEETLFPNNHFDLITVAQAYHWFDSRKFHQEAYRVGKNNCIIAIWMYDLLRCADKNINSLIEHFYKNITRPYWDAERRHVEDHYASLPFHFTPLPSKTFSSTVHYRKEDLLGYFSTWSAVKKYHKQYGHSPVGFIIDDLNKAWPDDTVRTFEFPINLRIGKIIK